MVRQLPPVSAGTLLAAWVILFGSVEAGPGAFASTVDPCDPPAQVQTDQRDYLPGTTAYITGCGFLAGEAVELQVLHIDGTANTGAQHGPWQVAAEASGSFQTSWLVCQDDCVNSTLELTATGLSSERIARALLSDACSTCFDAQLQGQSFGSTAWQTVNLTNWAELDFIPMRVLLTDGPASTPITL